jgi:hypothetical protein
MITRATLFKEKSVLTLGFVLMHAWFTKEILKETREETEEIE